MVDSLRLLEGRLVKTNFWKLTTLFLALALLLIILDSRSGRTVNAAGAGDDALVLSELQIIESKVGHIEADVRSYVHGNPIASYGTTTYHITKATALDISTGSVSVQGEIKGFSCTSDTKGNLDKIGGHISSEEQCFVLSK
jgi:hypothetical protein